jgi:hypothetical protein
MRLDSLRLVVLHAAYTMDVRGNKAGRYAIAQSKVRDPAAAAMIVVDERIMQMYVGAGPDAAALILPSLLGFASNVTGVRTLRC